MRFNHVLNPSPYEFDSNEQTVRYFYIVNSPSPVVEILRFTIKINLCWVMSLILANGWKYLKIFFITMITLVFIIYSMLISCTKLAFYKPVSNSKHYNKWNQSSFLICVIYWECLILFTDKINKEEILKNGGVKFVMKCLSR